MGRLKRNVFAVVCAAAVLGSVSGCRRKTATWPSAAGTAPYRQPDGGQALEPARAVLPKVEQGGAAKPVLHAPDEPTPTTQSHAPTETQPATGP